MGEFVDFWIMSAEERGEKYLHPATADDVADQLRAMGWTVEAPTGTMTVPQARKHLGLEAEGPPRAVFMPSRPHKTKNILNKDGG